MLDCPHPELYAKDGFNQMQRWGKCLLCERDALAARLASAEAWRDYYRAKWLGDKAVPQPEPPADSAEPRENSGD